MNSGKSLPEKRGSYERAYASPGTKQPTRILVVDVTPPFWSDICTCLCEALENFFALACSLGGPPRLPLLSLYVVHNQQECLLPFVQVKGNFPRLHSCVTELRSMPKEGCLRQKPDSLKHAVEDGLLQFKQYMRHLTVGGSLNNCSVEFLSPLFLMAHAGASKRAWVPFPYASVYQLITILTSQPGNRVVKELESGLNETDMVSLRRLQVLQIYKCNPMELMDTESSTALSSEDNTPDECSILGTDIDLQKVENDTVSLECFFKGWLHNHGTDKEHLHLLLPAGRLANSTQRTCLKCDVQERLLSPALLPGMTDLVGKTEGLRDCQNPNKAASPGLLQHKLQVVKALKSDGVCESVFYGLPLVIRPTNCWKLDWDELETNHHNFHALCHTLENRGLMLLARSEPQVMGSNWTVHIDSYYILLPSSTLTLLVKSVAVRELLLPCEFPYRSEAPPETALSKVQDILDGLDVEPTYNPLAVKSNLYKHLRGTLVRTPYRPQCKQVQRKDHHPPEHPKTQQHFKPYQSKMKATVAPLPMVRHSTNQAKSFRPALSMNSCSYNMSLLSDDDEFLADL